MKQSAVEILATLENRRESSTLEAKLATGGMPHSLWETYSAFANTQGGIILLGVGENEDGSLYPAGLYEPGEMAEELWERLEDPDWVSVNLLQPGDVQIVEQDSRAVLVINVPKAPPRLRPVYIFRDPARGAYRREDASDYRLSQTEIDEMRAAAEAGN